MDVTLVEHAEHEVDRHERGEQQEHLAGQRVLERLSRALERRRDRRRQVHGAFGALNLIDRRAQGSILRQIERDRDGRELREMADDERRFRGLDVGDRAQRHLARACRLRGQVEGTQGLQVGQAAGFGNQHDAILVRLVENRRDDALAEGVIERVVDGRRRDAVARRQLPVDFNVDGEPLVVEVAGDVAYRLDLTQARDQLGDVGREALLVRSAQHELILVRRDHGVERQILLGLEEQLDSGDAGDLGLQPPGDLRRTR